MSAETSTSNLVEEARRILLENYSAPAFIVDSDLNILHFQGDTSPFIKPSTGAASFHLLKMLRPEFAVDLRSLVHRARKDGTPVRKEAIEVEHGGQPKRVAMEVVPVARGEFHSVELHGVIPKDGTCATGEPQRTSWDPGKAGAIFVKSQLFGASWPPLGHL